MCKESQQATVTSELYLSVPPLVSDGDLIPPLPLFVPQSTGSSYVSIDGEHRSPIYRDNRDGLPAGEYDDVIRSTRPHDDPNRSLVALKLSDGTTVDIVADQRHLPFTDEYLESARIHPRIGELCGLVPDQVGAYLDERIVRREKQHVFERPSQPPWIRSRHPITDNQEKIAAMAKQTYVDAWAYGRYSRLSRGFDTKRVVKYEDGRVHMERETLDDERGIAGDIVHGVVSEAILKAAPPVAAAMKTLFDYAISHGDQSLARIFADNTAMMMSGGYVVSCFERVARTCYRYFQSGGILSDVRRKHKAGEITRLGFMRSVVTFGGLNVLSFAPLVGTATTFISSLPDNHPYSKAYIYNLVSSKIEDLHLLGPRMRQFRDQLPDRVARQRAALDSRMDGIGTRMLHPFVRRYGPVLSHPTSPFSEHQMTMPYPMSEIESHA